MSEELEKQIYDLYYDPEKGLQSETKLRETKLSLSLLFINDSICGEQTRKRPDRFW